MSGCFDFYTWYSKVLVHVSLPTPVPTHTDGQTDMLTATIRRLLSRHASTTTTMTWLNRSASPWTILALPSDIKNQNKQAIDKAYRKMLLQVHPDHGGTTELFLRVKQARDTLVAQHSGPDYMLSNDGNVIKKSIDIQFQEAVKIADFDTAWSLWAHIASGISVSSVTINMLDTYLELLTKMDSAEQQQVAKGKDKSSANYGIVEADRWQGLLVAMDGLQALRDSELFDTKQNTEERAWNGLLWHLSQLPEGWSTMNDTLIVLKKMDQLGITPDLELLESQVFTFFPRQ